MKSPRIFVFFAIPLLIGSLFTAACFAGTGLSISGMELADGGESGGFIVEKVYDGSPAYYAGILEGEMLLEVDHIALSDKSPSELENALSIRLGKGRSAVLTLLGPSGKVIVWLRPAIYTIGQRETLDFCQKLLLQKDMADSYWRRTKELFDDGITGEARSPEFEDRMSECLQGLNRSRMAIMDIPLPSYTGRKTVSLCSEARSIYTDIQFLRYDAWAKMGGYVLSRQGDKSFLQRRWDKVDPAVEKADRLDKSGGLVIERLLMSIGYGGNCDSLRLR